MREPFQRYPVTASYLAAVTGAALLMRFVFADGMSAQVRESLSANPRNLAHHPVNALLGSAFVLDAADGAVFTAVSLACLALCLGTFERTVGPWRAAAVVLTGHVTATLVATAVIGTGAYLVGLRDAAHLGVAYAAFTSAGAVAVLLPTVLRAPWLALVVVYALLAGDWHGVVPEFTAIGQVTAALTGAACGAFALHRAYLATGRA
ncbi:hypothetical protein JOF41_004445 [Saccharothrix coeruleofusca]|uniref:rhomboid-like protein n=1 Tax=Saccharothrix coeruleofusca TaxID=33919 RepID=UPI001AEAF344|nr:rhomboid-like protein [Saccharothrix coeruleofusca]MBP2338267.1 hypothetical protein [Saccharothrix coeruleofusca]